MADAAAEASHGLVDVPVGQRPDRARRRDRDRRRRQPNPSRLRDAAPTPARIADVLEQARAERAIEPGHLVVEVRDRDAHPARVVEVGRVDAHAGARPAVGAEGDAGLDADLLEGAVALVAIELVGLRVVGDDQIRPAVLIVVEHRHAERFRARVEDAARRGDVLERPVAAVAKEPAGVAAVGLGRAIRLLLAVGAAEDVVLGRPLDVVADEEVEQAVAIEVEPERRGAERGPSAKPARLA